MAISSTPVQTKTNASSTSVSTLSLTLDSTPTDGNVLIVGVAYLGATSTPGADCNVTCTNVTFTMCSPTAQGASSTCAGLFIGRVRGSAGTTVTVTTNQAGGIALAAMEFSGVSTAFDKYTNNTGSSTSPSTGTSATSATANQLWAAVLGHRASGGCTFSAATNSFTIAAQTRSTLSTTSDRSVCLLYRVVSGTGTMNAGATASTTGVWTGQAIGLEESAASGTEGYIKRTRATIGL